MAISIPTVKKKNHEHQVTEYAPARETTKCDPWENACNNDK